MAPTSCGRSSIRSCSGLLPLVLAATAAVQVLPCHKCICIFGFPTAAGQSTTQGNTLIQPMYQMKERHPVNGKRLSISKTCQATLAWEYQAARHACSVRMMQDLQLCIILQPIVREPSYIICSRFVVHCLAGCLPPCTKCGSRLSVSGLPTAEQQPKAAPTCGIAEAIARAACSKLQGVCRCGDEWPKTAAARLWSVGRSIWQFDDAIIKRCALAIAALYTYASCHC